MVRKQIMINFDNGKWNCDFITIEDGESQKDILDAYMNQYEQIRNSNALVGKMLPGIINISTMGD